MKRIVYIISALLLGLVSCNKTEFEPAEPKKAEPTGLVAVTMKLHIPVELQAQTKAVGDWADQPSIKSIRVAVFGTSGYPQAYALAEPIVSATDESTGTYATTDGDVYFFKVLLPVYDGEAHVHVIANGDESIQFVEMDEATIMKKMRTESPTGAYWARVIMPNGILTQLDNNGIMQTDDEGNYIPSAETAHLFEDLVLVRNFAEVVLLNESSDLKDISWVLVNVPKYGSVAPMSAGTYVDDFKDYEYDSATGKMKNGSKTYEGFMFEDDDLNLTVPTSVVDNPTTGTTTPYPASNFVYERYLPEDKATCILMKAHFRNDTDYTYYRLDLMDESVGGYYPIYRNYKYQVKIHKVGNRGASSITEAMNRDSGGNVSQTTEAKKLTDISDGESRLYVEFIERNYISGGKKTLWVQYVPDVTKDEDGDHLADVDNTNISIRVKTEGTALANTTITKLESSTKTGYYRYEFEVKDQTNVDLVSVLEITATNYAEGETIPEGKDKSTLYRDITLRVIKTMEMDLELVPNYVAAQGSTTLLKIKLPDGLPDSMFPLEFKIEDSSHSLYATGADGNGGTITVPVKSDKSIIDGTTNSFYFIRTVNKGEYDNDHTICTEFKTNKDASATTVYVANDYFETEHINLLNDGLYVNPTSATVDFNTTSVNIELEFASFVTGSKAWTATAGEGVTLSANSGTGNGSFTMSFPMNTGATEVTRTATVVFGEDQHDITITQKPLVLTVIPTEPKVDYNVTSTTVTVYAAEGEAWTATVDNGASITGAVEGTYSGVGTETLTVTFGSNAEGTTSRDFVVTATLSDDPETTATATITQRRGTASPYPFAASQFTMNTSNYTGNATSSDGIISIALTNAAKSGTGSGAFLTMGLRYYGSNYRGIITVTPQDGFKITQIKVTYSDADNASYDFGNTYTVSVNPGTYTRDSNTSSTATWTGSSTGAVTFTNGMRTTSGTRHWPQITNIEVTYSAVD